MIDVPRREHFHARHVQLKAGRGERIGQGATDTIRMKLKIMGSETVPFSIPSPNRVGVVLAVEGIEADVGIKWLFPNVN